MGSSLRHRGKDLTNASVHLDAIRGLAAAAVFLSHGRMLFIARGLRNVIAGSPDQIRGVKLDTSPLSAHALPRQSIGHEAVIVFFVLSGYFVGGSVLRSFRESEFSWTKYLLHRMTRLWVVLIPALIIGWSLDQSGMHLLHGMHNIYSGYSSPEIAPGLSQRLTLGTFLGNILFLQGIVTPCLGTNLPLWSLAFEFWFYLLFPLALVALGRSEQAAVRRAGAACCFLAAALLCDWIIMAYFIIWLSGAAIAAMPLILSENQRKLGVKAFSVLFLAALYLGLKYSINILLSDLILASVVAVLMWIILHDRANTTKRGYRSAAQHLSRMSYTLYLVHLPALAFICGAVMPVWTPWALSAPALGKLAGICLVVFAWSWIIYWLFERNTDMVRLKIIRLIGERLPELVSA